MKRVLILFVLLVLLTLPVMPANSMRADTSSVSSHLETSCPEIVEYAWDNIDQLCVGTGRNEACYGHVLLDAQPQPQVAQFEFDEEGHIVDLVDLQSLRLSTMDLVNGYWGVALLRIRANLPTTAPNKNVSLLLFGDVEIENAVETLPELEVKNASPFNWLNVRYRPTTQSLIMGTIAPEAVVLATGRVTDSSWVRVQVPDSGVEGWVFASLLDSVDPDADFDALVDVDPASSYFGPMQAFYFQSGTDDAACPEAPNSGMLIQTPEGVAEVTLLINEVDIQLGSTVYFQAQSGDEMTVSVVEGHATVTTGGTTETAVAGTQIGVPLGADGAPSGPPSTPRPYDMSGLQGLPVDHMERSVVVTEPLTEDEYQAFLEQQVIEADTTDDNVDGPPGLDDNPALGDDGPPGLDDNPALGDDGPPGQTGSLPPGQEDKDEKDKKIKE